MRPLSQQRSHARRRVLQALYQWELNDADLSEIESQFMARQDMSKADLSYFHELLHRIPAVLDVLDAGLARNLDRELDRLDPIEKSVLRIAAYELEHRVDVPYRVVINEAVALTRTFGAEQGHKYVNAVLDALALQLRPEETEASAAG